MGLVGILLGGVLLTAPFFWIAFGRIPDKHNDNPHWTGINRF